jgi:hypothetical protein
MRPDAAPEPIVCCKTGAILGEFLPGLGYWITPQNLESAAKVLKDGRAYLDDPKNAPFQPGTHLGAGKARVQGRLTIGG